MIVSVDLGNKNIKTPELLFLTGLDSYDSNPSTTFFRNDCIQYEGKYYTVGSHRIEYTRYKHTDDRFFILTLMAVAKEIKRRGLKGDNYEVELLLSLPPAHYRTQHENLKNYMMMKGQHVNFMFNDNPMSVTFKDVIVFIQGHAALYTRSNLTKEEFSNYIVSEYDLHLREDDIDNLIKNRTLPSNLAAIQTKVLDTLDTMALQYLKRGIKTFIEDKIDLKMYTSVFVGGASLIFKPYILQLQEEGLLGKVIFIEDVHANAKGAQILYKSAKSLMNKQ